MLERLGTLLVVQLCVGVGAAARDARHELDHHAPRAEDGEEERGDEQGRGVGGAERQLLEGGERGGDLLVHDEGGEAGGDEEQEQEQVLSLPPSEADGEGMSQVSMIRMPPPLRRLLVRDTGHVDRCLGRWQQGDAVAGLGQCYTC